MADIIVQSATLYGWIGAVVGLAFILWGIDRVDPSARGAYAFRPVLLPGLILLWPFVVLRWLWLERRR